MTIRSFAPAVFAVCFCVCAAASVDELRSLAEVPALARHLPSFSVLS